MDKKAEGEKEGGNDLSKKEQNLRRGVVFITPNNEYYRNKNLGFGWAITHESKIELTWGEGVKEESENTIELKRSKINNLKTEFSLWEVYGEKVGDEEFKCWYKKHFGIFWAIPVKVVEDIEGASQ